MADLTYREAMSRALREALQKDPTVFIMGEDVGAYGGAYAVTKGFLEEFGPNRIKDTPISEDTIVGTGLGAAMGGLRPVVELMTINFSLLAMDQIINNAAKLCYMSGGQIKLPVIIRTVTGGGAGLGATHSQSLEGMFAAVPGLTVVAPATPSDALGLFRTCHQQQNPILFIEHILLYSTRGPVPDAYYEVPLGLADVKREGQDLTLVSYSRSVLVALQAAQRLAGELDIEAEVVDLRTLRPLDMETVVTSVKKTSRVMVVEEAWRSGALGAEVAARIQEEAFDYLDSPVARVGAAETPAPYARNLERASIPDEASVVQAVRAMLGKV